MIQALSLVKWRALTAQVLQSDKTRSAFETNNGRTSSVHASLDMVDRVLRPFANGRMNDVQRRRNLEEIIKRSANFALTLFSQPSSYDFDWQVDPCTASGELCLFPALMQVADEFGRPIRPSWPFSEAGNRSLHT